MTKNRRAVGTLGLATIVAVLAVSMIAVNFTAQPAVADHIAAKKGGGASPKDMTLSSPGASITMAFMSSDRSRGRRPLDACRPARPPGC